ncbi:hypothetical protein EYE40_11555 [Glaciihabitans arcticus]|uniref:DUF998 domain-containing protein n=1 Tax=Glaciihabitans arcticus TaxID=2668039 RepID=A0A4V2JF36_9MICO|nr:hypothetical protein [Glaciihabitans arcticus]TBN57979.1 hypothetical protein EYE40_11555 [Glaciihabitans arcticus]
MTYGDEPVPARATARRQWITVTALTPIILITATMSGYTFPFVIDAMGLECSGESVGEGPHCPDCDYSIGASIYSGVLITAMIFVVVMLLVVLTARVCEREGLARDFQIVTMVVGCIPIALGAPVVLYSTRWELIAMAFAHVAATTLLIVGLTRGSRWLAVVACAIGVLAAFGPLVSPVYSAFQATTAAWFAVTLLALIVARSPRASSGPMAGVTASA